MLNFVCNKPIIHDPFNELTPLPPSLFHKEGGCNALYISYIPPLYGVERGIKGVSS